MDNRPLCRVCLANGFRLYVVTSEHLQQVYEKLANAKLEMEDGRPSMLCYICYAQLRRCHMFQQAVRRSEALLTQMYSSGAMFTEDVLAMIERPVVHTYSVTPTENVNITICDSEEAEQLNKPVKLEAFDSGCEKAVCEDIEIPADMKLDPDSETVDNTDHYEANPSTTDSEDDVPLKNLMKEVKVERQKRKYIKRNKLDVREVVLSKEQQLQDVLSRATSHNYLHSPYRCALCYRGFVNHDAYTNHIQKHDKRSGPHECDVCKMRYRSVRLLRTHARTAHAHRYTCNKCGHTTHTKHQASDHERWHNGQTYECQLCSQKFVKRTSYLTHVRSHHPSRHVCVSCGAHFLGRHGLRMHAVKAHAHTHQEADISPASARYCAACDIQFMSRLAWTRHVLTAGHDLHIKQCPICSTTISGSVSDHMREHEKNLRRPRVTPPAHTGGVRISCQQCSQTFVSKGKLSAHVRRVHLGFKYNKNIVCEVCGKKCTSNASLKYHQRTHTGERPHACLTCGKTFADNNQRRIHTRTHTGETPYTCHTCGRGFKQKPALNRHYRVHTGAKPYTCELCSKSFSQSNSLKVHVRAVHLKMPTYRRKQAGTNAKSGTDVGISGTDVAKSGTDVGKSDTDVARSEDVKIDQGETMK